MVAPWGPPTLAFVAVVWLTILHTVVIFVYPEHLTNYKGLKFILPPISLTFNTRFVYFAYISGLLLLIVLVWTSTFAATKRRSTLQAERHIGHPNIGHPNIDDPNIGDPNIGHPNIDDPNIDDPNIGDPNVGHPNIGHPNIGHPNIGGPNIGGPNIGDPNIGDPNIGDPMISSSSQPLAAATWSKYFSLGSEILNLPPTAQKTRPYLAMVAGIFLCGIALLGLQAILKLPSNTLAVMTDPCREEPRASMGKRIYCPTLEMPTLGWIGYSHLISARKSSSIGLIFWNPVASFVLLYIAMGLFFIYLVIKSVKSCRRAAIGFKPRKVSIAVKAVCLVLPILNPVQLSRKYLLNHL